VLTGTEESRPAWRSVHEGRRRDDHVDNACQTTQCQAVTGKTWQAWDMLCFKRTRRRPRRPLDLHKAPIIAIPVAMSTSKRPPTDGRRPIGKARRSPGPMGAVLRSPRRGRTTWLIPPAQAT